MASRGLTSSISGPTRGSNGGRKSGQRSTITRVRTGCFTCRKRKKKCDEQKPACGNCQKTGVVCEGFPQPEHWENRIAAKRHLARSANAITRPHGLEFQEVATVGVHTPVFELPLADSLGFSDPTHPNYDFMIEPQYGGDLDYAFNQPSATDFEGMLGLSNEVGSFGGHQSFNWMIMASEERSYLQEEHRECLGAQQSFIPTELPFLISGVDTDIQQRLFCHFTGVMSSLLAMSVKDSNPFNGVVIPLALRDRTVMDTVLCLAGSHLAKLQQGGYNREVLVERSRLHEAAVQAQAHRIKTLKSLPLPPRDSYTVSDQEAIVATSLLLCLYEICEGTGDDAWRFHLDMARQVITAVSREADSPSTNGDRPTATDAQEPIITDINPFLLEFFLYHDSLATVTVPSLPITRPIQSTADILPNDSYMVGVQDGLSDFVTRISTLRVQAVSSKNQPDGDVVSKAVLIWQDLARWKPKAAVSVERQLITEFYQWALFIWLFSIVYPEGKADEKVQGTVKLVADRMCNIKSGEGGMSCLLFPLFVIGSAAIRNQDQEAISAQFARLRAWSSLGNIDLTYSIVQQMWQDHDLGRPKSWDWVRQLEMQGMSFLVT